MVAGVPLVRTFVKVPAATRYECPNRTLEKAVETHGFEEARSPGRWIGGQYGLAAQPAAFK